MKSGSGEWGVGSGCLPRDTPTFRTIPHSPFPTPGQSSSVVFGCRGDGGGDGVRHAAATARRPVAADDDEVPAGHGELDALVAEAADDGEVDRLLRVHVEQV